MRMLCCILMVILAGCSGAPAQDAVPKTGGVVSLDLCADQAVLSLVSKGSISAVSPEAESDPAYALPASHGIPRIRPTIEDVLSLKPDIVVRSYGGGANMDRQLRAAGVRVVQLGYAQSLADVAPNLRKTAAQLNDVLPVSERGATLAAAFDAQLAALPVYDSAPRMLYLTPGNVTAGADSFVGQMILAAGFRPYSDRTGWPSLPLEEMQIDPPAFVTRGFFDSAKHKQDAWSLSRHPALTKAIQGSTLVDIPGGWLACGNHLSMNAILAMAQARKMAQAKMDGAQ